VRIQSFVALTLGLALFGVATEGRAEAKSARELGLHAFELAGHWPPDRDRVVEARLLADRALAADPLDAMAQLGASRAILAGGFRGGDPLDKEGYDPVARELALQHILVALAREPVLAEAQAQAGLLFLLAGKHRKAERALLAAHALAPESFEVALYRSALALDRGQIASTRVHARTAEDRAESRAEHSRLHALSVRIAANEGDPSEERSVHEAYLAEFPGDLAARVAYASFLSRRGLYSEAIAEYEEVLAIEGNPAARAGLEKARLRGSFADRTRYRGARRPRSAPNAAPAP